MLSRGGSLSQRTWAAGEAIGTAARACRRRHTVAASNLMGVASKRLPLRKARQYRLFVMNIIKPTSQVRVTAVRDWYTCTKNRLKACGGRGTRT